MKDLIQSRTKGNEFRTSTICVDAFNSGAVSGRMYNPIIHGTENFENLMQLLLQMDTMLDMMNFPQSFEEKRKFADVGRQAASLIDTEKREGQVATFAVKILFRQNASWQGSITWLEGEREESFRSVLELIFLMNSALENAKSKKVS
jgi:hypothetical protein